MNTFSNTYSNTYSYCFLLPPFNFFLHLTVVPGPALGASSPGPWPSFVSRLPCPSRATSWSPDWWEETGASAFASWKLSLLLLGAGAVLPEEGWHPFTLKDACMLWAKELWVLWAAGESHFLYQHLKSASHPCNTVVRGFLTTHICCLLGLANVIITRINYIERKELVCWGRTASSSSSSKVLAALQGIGFTKRKLHFPSTSVLCLFPQHWQHPHYFLII